MNLGLVNEVTKSQLKTDIPAFRSGSTVRVHVITKLVLNVNSLYTHQSLTTLK